MNGYLFFVTLPLAIVIILIIRHLALENKRLKKNLDYYKTTYLTRIGDTMDYKSYRLVSLDGGLTWYASKRDPDDKTVKIIGPVDEVYPGLLSHLEGWDALLYYVEEHGPIVIGDNTTLGDLNAMKNAGFTVTENS